MVTLLLAVALASPIEARSLDYSPNAPLSLGKSPIDLGWHDPDVIYVYLLPENTRASDLIYDREFGPLVPGEVRPPIGNAMPGPIYGQAPAPSHGDPVHEAIIVFGLHAPFRISNLTFNLAPVPEPGTWALCLLGVGGLVVLRKKRHERSRPVELV